MEWRLKEWNELDTDELYAILRLRAEVFVVEQNCPYQDLDNKDQKSIHLYCMTPTLETGRWECIACLRLVKPGISYEEWSIGRVVTAKKVRGTGIGKEIMHKAMQHLANENGRVKIRISAQCYLQGFYESFGFEAVSDSYLEDDIPHIEMLYTPQLSY